MTTAIRVWVLSAISALAGILLEGILDNYVVHGGEEVVAAALPEELFISVVGAVLTATLVTLVYMLVRHLWFP